MPFRFGQPHCELREEEHPAAITVMTNRRTNDILLNPGMISIGKLIYFHQTFP